MIDRERLIENILAKQKGLGDEKLNKHVEKIIKNYNLIFDFDSLKEEYPYLSKRDCKKFCGMSKFSQNLT